MPKYLCLQRSLPGGGEGEQPSPAQMQAMYGKFNEWREKFPKVSGASRELKDKVANTWRDFLEKKLAGK